MSNKNNSGFWLVIAFLVLIAVAFIGLLCVLGYWAVMAVYAWERAVYIITLIVLISVIVAGATIVVMRDMD